MEVYLHVQWYQRARRGMELLCWKDEQLNLCFVTLPIRARCEPRDFWNIGCILSSLLKMGNNCAEINVLISVFHNSGTRTLFPRAYEHNFPGVEGLGLRLNIIFTNNREKKNEEGRGKGGKGQKRRKKKLWKILKKKEGEDKEKKLSGPTARICPCLMIIIPGNYYVLYKK